MSIGERLKKLRLAQGLTMEELSEIIGIKYQTIQKYEHDMVTNIPSDKIELLAKVFHVSPGYIMGWTDRYGHYMDRDTGFVAQEIFDDPSLRTLFSAAKDCSPEDIQLAADLLKRMKKTNYD